MGFISGGWLWGVIKNHNSLLYLFDNSSTLIEILLNAEIRKKAAVKVIFQICNIPLRLFINSHIVIDHKYPGRASEAAISTLTAAKMAGECGKGPGIFC